MLYLVWKTYLSFTVLPVYCSKIAFTKSCDILNKPYMQQIAIYVKPTKHSGDKTFAVWTLYEYLQKTYAVASNASFPCIKKFVENIHSLKRNCLRFKEKLFMHYSIQYCILMQLTTARIASFGLLSYFITFIQFMWPGMRRPGLCIQNTFLITVHISFTIQDIKAL